MRAKYILGGLFFILLASVSGVLIAIWVFKHFNIYIPLENQSVSIDLQEPLQAKVQIQDALDVDVTGRVNAEILIYVYLSISVIQTLMPQVYFDNQVTIKTTIPVQETLKVSQDLPIDTRVKIKILGKDISLPLKGNIPIKLDVPIDLKVPLNQIVHLKFDAPVKAVLKQNLRLPLDATLNTNIPIKGHLNVPVKTALAATVDVKNTLPVKIQQGQLKIPLNSVVLSRTDAIPIVKPRVSQAQANQKQTQIAPQPVKTP